jgi:hypothetical protein
LDDAVAGLVACTGQFYAPLVDKSRGQAIHLQHHLVLPVYFEQAVFFHCGDTFEFDITRDDTGKGAP